MMHDNTLHVHFDQFHGYPFIYVYEDLYSTENSTHLLLISKNANIFSRVANGFSNFLLRCVVRGTSVVFGSPNRYCSD